MEWMLLAATMVSLGLAVTMSIVAWRLLRGEHERSAARVEALEAMAFAETSESGPAQREPSWDAVLAPRPEPTAAATPTPAVWQERAGMGSHPLFDDTPAPPVLVKRSLAVGAFVVALAGVGGTIALVRSPGVLAAVSSSVPSANRPAVNGTPLELLSLRHALDSPGVFSVTGLVQNPPNARQLDELEAVLYLFDESGQYFTSGRAPLDTPTLGPGDESAFVVRIPTAAAISRYRVGFRRADGRSVAHVDHRGQLPQGTTGDVLRVEPDEVTPARAERPEPSSSGRTGVR